MIEKLVAWLRDECGMENVAGGKLTIAATTWSYAARYSSPHHDGREFLYAIGSLPPSYRRRKSTVYRFEGDDRDWFVASYFQHDTEDRASYTRIERKTEHHPFGHTFLLSPWDTSKFPEGSRHPIDHGSRYGYRRVVARFEPA